MKSSSVQTEIDAGYLYKKLAENEKDESIAEIFREMSSIESGHAEIFAKKYHIDLAKEGKPSLRARTLNAIGKLFSYNYVLGSLLDTEKSLSNAIANQKNKLNIKVDGSETNHVQILKNILDKDQKFDIANISKFEKRHHTVGGNAIRAAVLGGNDGLVSNFSLVMGVAGATQGGQGVLLAGIAGLLAGALSMALGEWISVKSSQELYENQMDLEMEELETNPEGEKQELILIYRAKGIPKDQAIIMANEIIQDKGHAHAVLVKEELGINPEELKSSAIEAAVSSFILFSIGAILPVLPFFLTNGTQAIMFSVLTSTLGLFIIGAAITLFTGKNMLKSGLRQVFFGLAAATITFCIGKIIGVSIG